MDGPWKPSWPGALTCRRLWVASLLAGLGASVVAHGPAGQAPGHDIESISLERECFGCSDGGVVELRRDGTAMLTLKGHARLGTQDRRLQGRVARGDFAALAALAATGGVMAFDDIYQPADIVDGQWIVLTVRAARRDKQVFSREGAGPEALHGIVAAVDALRATIRFEPTP